MNGEVDRIVLSRPAVEAGERLGFLPGDMKEKVDPYLRPLYDALYDVMPASLVTKGIAENQIEIAPLAFMRGRTLAGAFVILDEAQNTTPQQMKMFLTRLGEGSRMVVTGDPTQVDLPSGISSGLADAVTCSRASAASRPWPSTMPTSCAMPLVGRIVAAYDKKAAKPNAMTIAIEVEDEAWAAVPGLEELPTRAVKAALAACGDAQRPKPTSLSCSRMMPRSPR